VGQHEIDSVSRVLAAQKNLKKIEKKACHSPGPSAKSDTGGQKGLIKRSKKN